MAEGLALSDAERIEIISMYATSAEPVLAVAADPGWQTVGMFPMRVSANIRFSVIGTVSDASLTLTTRLYCLTPGFVGEVTGSRVQHVGELIGAEQVSPPCTLTAGRLYEVQAEVTGNAGPDYYGNVWRAGPETA